MHPCIGCCWKAAKTVENMSRGELERLQQEKLRSILTFAATNVPFYRKWIKEHNIDLSSLSVDDFPIIEKKDIRGRESEFVADGWQKRVHWTRTSGSTGEPFRFARSEYDYAYAALWRGLLRYGIHPGDKRVLIKGVDETASVPRMTMIKRAIYGWVNRCIVVDAHFLARSESNVEHELNRILTYKPIYLHGYVSSIYLLARYAEEHNIDFSLLKLKAVVTESEKCHDFQRETMERVFNAPIVEDYGSVEFGMIAQPGKDGELYINDDHVYLEVTSDGEAVFTNLDEYGFPLVRFKNGDIVKVGDADGELPYRKLLNIDGRVTETIKLPQGGCLQGFVVMYPISKHFKWMRAYQIYQPEIGRLIIRIVLAKKCLLGEIQEQILKEMRDIVGEKINIEFEFLDNIPLSRRGKRLFVCSDVHNTEGEVS